MSSPTPEAQAGVMDLESSGEAYDALADLFLGDAPAGQPLTAPTRAAAGTVPVELMVLGHLPVTAAGWAMQYARQVAHDVGGPVAALRLRGGEISIEVVGAGDKAEQQPIAHLPTAIAAAARVVRRWLVRVDDMAEPLAAQLAGLDSITLLTGADEAAVVSAYQMIKGLGSGGPAVRLALMGAAPERAMESAERIAKTASAHLSRKITVTASVSRIAGGRSYLLHRGPLIGDEVDALNTIVDQIRLRKPDAPTTPAPAPAPVQSGRPAAPAPTTVQMPRPVVVSQPVTAPAAPRPANVAPAMVADVSSSVAAVIAHLGLEALPFNCPSAPAAQLAVDRDGRLNIVVGAAGGDVASAAGNLVVASVWTRQQADLLRMATAAFGKGLSGADAPVMRIVTSEPKHAKPLLDGDMRLHLAAQTGQGWFVTDLN